MKQPNRIATPATAIRPTVLIDGMNACYRHFHKLNSLKTTEGVRTGLIYGFIQMLKWIQSRYKDRIVYVLWDTKAQWRYDLYPAYKEKRKDKRKTEEYEEIMARTADLQEILKHHDVRQVQAAGFEADDLAAVFADAGNAILYSGDKDWMQLLNDERNVKVLRPQKGKQKLYTEQTFTDELGFPPQGYVVYKCLRGKKNEIKGVYRFPEKLAIDLANKIQSVESFWYDKSCLLGVSEKWQAAIAENKDDLRIKEKISHLHPNVPDVKIVDGKYDVEKLREHYENFELSKFLVQIKKATILKTRGVKSAKRKKFKLKRED